MKNPFLIILFAFISIISLNAEVWTKKADIVSFGGKITWRFSGTVAIGDTGYIFAGGVGPVVYTSEVWAYYPQTNKWAKKASFGGGTSAESSAFVLNDKAYVCGGVNPGKHNWLYEYNASTNIWTKKADFPGGNYAHNVAFAINGKGYSGLGFDAAGNVYQGFYEYDPGTDTWKKMPDFPGGGRWSPYYFAIGSKGYVGGGATTNQWASVYSNDWWEFDPSVPGWKKLANFPGSPRGEAVSFSKCNFGYLTNGHSGTEDFKDFWEYDPVKDKWTRLTDFPGGVRSMTAGFAIREKCYIGFGYDNFIGNHGFSDLYEWKTTADFKTSTSDTAICAKESLDFVDMSHNHAVKWNWTFNGAAPHTSTLKNPTGVKFDTAGTYTVILIGTDSCGFPDTAVKTIKVYPAIPADAGPDVSICYGNNTTLSGSGGTKYTWSPVNDLSCTNCDKPTANPTATTTYIVTVSGALGCSNEDTVVVFVNPLPAVTLGNDTAFCFGKSIVLDAGNPGSTYKWNNGSTGRTYTADSIGLYFVEVTDTNGCKKSDSIQVTVYPQVIPVVKDTLICKGDTAFILAHGGTNYSWNTGDTLPYIKVSPAVETTYTVTAFDAYGCSALADMQLEVGLLPVADFKAEDTSVFEYQYNKFTDLSSLATKWIWNFGDDMGSSNEQNPTYPYKKKGKYSVKLIVISKDGCRDTLLKIEYMLVKPTQLIFIPSSFTPNGDFKNDILYVRGPVKSMNFKIYNQWGLLMFETTDKKTGWDGTWNGNSQPEGNYIYVFEGITMDDSQVNQQGVISLIR